MIDMEITTEGFFEVAIDSYPEWLFPFTTTEFLSDALTNWPIRPWVQFAFRPNFLQLLLFHRFFSVRFHFGYCLRQSPQSPQSKFSWGTHISVGEWVDDIYGNYHWTTLWSSYSKLTWIGYESTTTEFRSGALTHWAIRSWVELALRANFLQLLQFHCSFNVKFHFGYCLRQAPGFFYSKFYWGNNMSVLE